MLIDKHSLKPFVNDITFLNHFIITVIFTALSFPFLLTILQLWRQNFRHNGEIMYSNNMESCSPDLFLAFLSLLLFLNAYKHCDHVTRECINMTEMTFSGQTTRETEKAEWWQVCPPRARATCCSFHLEMCSFQTRWYHTSSELWKLCMRHFDASNSSELYSRSSLMHPCLFRSVLTPHLPELVYRLAKGTHTHKKKSKVVLLK